MFAPLRRTPERWLFVGLVAVLLAPVIAQGIDRPLASLLGAQPAGVALTPAAIVVALVAWLVHAAGAPRRLALAGILIGAVALGLALGPGASGLVALVAVAAVAVALARALPGRLPPALDGVAARARLLTSGYVLVALFSVVQVGRVSVFIADPARTEAQIVPGVKFLETHSCLTAYVHAQALARDGVNNLYLAERWPELAEGPERPVTPYSPFDLDAYFYPPPFLLIAELLAPLRGDFLAQRAAWFGLGGLALMAAFGLAARAFGGARWHRPLLVAPLFFGSLPVLSILQVGNAQALVVAAAILGMLAFEVRRPALGGFALALATAAKISPGIFGVVLLLQRRWRAVAWTAALGALLLGLALVAYGLDPMRSWITYALPRLSSGEAFAPMLGHAESVALNLAPSGLPFKLPLVGVDIDDPWPIARRINQVFTVVVVALAIVIGRRHASAAATPEGRSAAALAWMALLFLAALRSPFAPGYVTFSFIWALTILTVEVETWRGGLALLVLFALTTIIPPLPLPALTMHLTVVEILAIGVAMWLILRRPPARGG